MTKSENRVGLVVWRKALLCCVQSGHPALTNRQMAILMVARHEQGPHTVRGLAARLGVAKPVVTRAVNMLTALCLVCRRPDPRDRRSVFVYLTDEGETFLDDFAMMIDGAALSSDTETRRVNSPTANPSPALNY